MKKTALYQSHIDLGAKMIPFAGYEMPVQYKGLNHEHQIVRNGVGIFDVSHMGEFVVTGAGSLDFLQKVTTNDVAKLVNGQAQYSCMPNETGGIVDDLLVYKLDDHKYLLVVNASNIEKDWNHLQKYAKNYEVTMSNKSDDYSLFAIQGPKATEVLQALTSVDLSQIKYYHFEVGPFAGVDYVIISATGYTGAGGFEIYVSNAHAVDVWNKIMEAGASLGIEPIGLGARDTLRLEMGFCLYGNDIDDTTSPIEAGLGWITKFTKDFVNSETFKKQKEDGVSQKLVGLELLERGIARKDYPITDAEGNEIGRITSGTMAPSLNKPIALGYVKTDFAKKETEVFVKIREKLIRSKVVAFPFK
jgi:aminomethyltransferase